MGDSIVALASNGIHLVWRWPRNGFNLDGKVMLYSLSFDMVFFSSCFFYSPSLSFGLSLLTIQV